MLMFADAYLESTRFTRPLVTCLRDVDGNCTSAMGTFVLLNEDGWAVTADHIVQHLAELQSQTRQAQELRVAEAKIAEEPDANKRRARAKKLKRTHGLTEFISVWFGQDGVDIDGTFQRYPSADLALFRLKGMAPGGQFPRFKRPGVLRPGTSLIKVGYPFHVVEPTWDDAAQGFAFDETLLSLIPIEGIFTRIVTLALPPGAPAVDPPGLPIARLETSSPGLRGQSGGPTLDREGVVWGIQSSTMHFDLGFSPQKVDGGKMVTEHQFLNAGWGIPPAALEVVFADAGVTVQWSD